MTIHFHPHPGGLTTPILHTRAISHGWILSPKLKCPIRLYADPSLTPCLAHSFVDFSLCFPLIQEEQGVNYWRKKMVAKWQNKTGKDKKTTLRDTGLEQLTPIM